MYIARYIPIRGNGSKTTGQCGIGFALKSRLYRKCKKSLLRSKSKVRSRWLPLSGVANRPDFALLGSNASHLQWSIAKLFHINSAGFFLWSIESERISRGKNILRRGQKRRIRRLIPILNHQLNIFTTVLIGRYCSYIN